MSVGHDEIGIEVQFRAEAVAVRAGAGGGVEREQARLDLLDGEAGDGAGEAFGEDDALVRVVFGFVGAFGVGLRERLVGEFGDGEAVGELERCSKQSARRVAMSARTTMRSTTTSMSCLNFLSSFGASPIS